MSKNRKVWVLVKKVTIVPTPITPIEGLYPMFDNTYSGTSTGAYLTISNFDSNFSWSISTNNGQAVIDNAGKITLTEFLPGSAITILVTTSRNGYESASRTLTFSPNMAGLKPIQNLASIKVGTDTYSFEITNYDPTYSWSVTSSSGETSLGANGLVTVSKLMSGKPFTISINAHKPGYFDGNLDISAETLPFFKSISQRDWQLIAKDPEGAKGQFVKVFGKITQFDAATGLTSFRADIAGVNVTDAYGFWLGADNTFLIGNPTDLKYFVNGDKFIANVKVVGAYTYTTTLNGKLTVPELQVYEITLLK